MINYCPFCKSQHLIEKRQLVSILNSKNYQLLECTDCQLQFFTPLVFEDIYSDERIPEYVNFHQGRVFLPTWTCEAIKVIRQCGIDLVGKNILEIGAGDGINYQGLKENFAIKPEHYFIVELDVKSVVQCRLRGLHNIFHTMFNDSLASQLKRQFDLVLLLEVFEHQIQPKEFLTAVFSVLKPGGLVILTVPNRERFFLRQLEFQGDLPPHHFLRFNKSFFERNFSADIVYINNFKHHFNISNVQRVALKLANVLKMPMKLWWVVLPLVPMLKGLVSLAGSIIGEGIIIVLKYEGQSLDYTKNK